MAYNTRQRTLLFDFLQRHHHSHVSMQEILDFARAHAIGTATVYRYLDKLTRDGQLSKYTTDAAQGGTCFQWRDAACTLYHFVCSDCGKCFHVDCPHIAAIHNHITENHAFEVDLSQTVFRGRCASCAGKELS